MSIRGKVEPFEDNSHTFFAGFVNLLLVYSDMYGTKFRTTIKKLINNS